MAKTTRKKVINILDDLRQPLADARAYERGEEVDLRVMEIAPPPRPMKPSEIRKGRESDGVRAFSLRQSKNSSGLGARNSKATEYGVAIARHCRKHPKFLLATASARAK